MGASLTPGKGRGLETDAHSHPEACEVEEARGWASMEGVNGPAGAQACGRPSAQESREWQGMQW
jgi:hypothetical protein